MPSRAFTLIELLVVTAIIVSLAAMLTMIAPLLRERALVSRTEMALAGLRQALSLPAIETGSNLSPAEHPLAGSAAPRLRFLRAADASAVATSGEALRGVAPQQLVPGPDRARVLLEDDRFADPTVPGLYGLRRDELTILGAPLDGITAYRRLPGAEGAALAPPYDSSAYPDRLHLVRPPPGQGPETHKRVIDEALGASRAQGELAGVLETMATADESGGQALAGGRLWHEAGAAVEPRWFGASIAEGGRWWAYRLRGLACYDAWGGEILYVLRDGTIDVISAGPDGAFLWHPGPDGILQTAATATQPAGDDRDARGDNLASGWGIVR